ncbi:hypothetical protein LCGC14_1954560 [marine sediment metagenome]|uniref:Uncharacterized protein n=1 Tax=marine sediment metagenome TaxID=412755 RepID=A0A0F9G4S5_9ZZZZ
MKDLNIEIINPDFPVISDFGMEIINQEEIQKCPFVPVNLQKVRKTYENRFIYLKLEKAKNQEKPIYSSIYVSAFSKSKKTSFFQPKQKRGDFQGK